MKEPQSRTRSKLNICIDSALKEAVIFFANDDGRSISWLVEGAMRDFLQKQGKPVPPKGPGRLRLTGASKALSRRGDASPHAAVSVAAPLPDAQSSP